MFLFSSPVKKIGKELDSLYSGKYMLDAKYEELLKKTQCRECPKHIRGKLAAYHDHYPDCGDCEKYPAVKELIDRLDAIPEKAEEILTGPYAEAVWKMYGEKKPALRRVEDGAALRWEEVFGNDLAACSREQRRDLAGLVEGTGRYALKK